MDHIDDISNIMSLFKNDFQIFLAYTNPPFKKQLDEDDAKRLEMSAWYYKFP